VASGARVAEWGEEACILAGMAAHRERAPNESTARVDPSLLHVCAEVATEILGRGLDPSLVHADARISLLAARQDGIVAWAQLIALGVGRGTIARRVERGTLVALHRGVYVWATPTPTFSGRVRAAVMAGGPGAVASHDASAAMWRFRRPYAGPIDVTAVGRTVRARGVRGHEVAALHRADKTAVRAIAVTSPARALLEIAPRLTPRELADAVEQAQVRRLVTKRDIAATLERAGARAGVRALRAVLEEPAFTRSRAERRLVALLRAAKLPQPAFNAVAEGFEVDALWRRERVVLEFDSYAFHATHAAFERDRRRTAALQRGRYVVLRTTWRELTKQSHALIARTAEALAFSTSRPP